ncbi:DUF202 domain-containing protein (plasmid) [Fusobacteria bacterium ZRK30]|nr:DUF202 domain-containing protein [Fusobacteria bacterium ZRK30]
MEKRYAIYEKENMILRDCLATDRTILANERTYLAYLRTVVSFLAAGIGLIKYVDDGLFIQSLGWLFLLASMITLVIGTKKFIRTWLPLKKLFQ